MDLVKFGGKDTISKIRQFDKISPIARFRQRYLSISREFHKNQIRVPPYLHVQ